MSNSTKSYPSKELRNVESPTKEMVEHVQRAWTDLIENPSTSFSIRAPSRKMKQVAGTLPALLHSPASYISFEVIFINVSI